MTFAQFKSEIRARVWPEGEPENLVTNHNKWILDSLIDLQRKVPCLQQYQVDIVPQCATYLMNGSTVFGAPRGYIHKLYTLSNDPDDRCQVEYSPITKDELDCMASSAPCCPGGQTFQHPYGAYGFYAELYNYYPDSGLLGMEFPSADEDKPCRATSGYYTLHRGNLWVFPHMQWTESAVVEWDGIKRTYAEEDLVSFGFENVLDREVEDAVEYYLRYKAAQVEDCDFDRARDLLLGPPGQLGAGYNGKVADLIWECKKERRMRDTPPCFNNRC